MGAIGASKNSHKLNGFSITDNEGKTTSYIAIDGTVMYADGRVSKSFAGDSLEVVQRAYTEAGSTEAMIKRVNDIGIASAKSISDADVEKVYNSEQANRNSFREWLEKEAYKRKGGVNRHRAYWSAM